MYFDNHYLQLLLDLGQRYRHFVSNAKLHQMKTVGDVVDFYTTPVDNLPTYAKMARDTSLPENLAIREHPARFHPNDIHAPHGGTPCATICGNAE